MANEMRPELTIAACRLASVPPSTATIMTFFQKLPPMPVADEGEDVGAVGLNRAAFGAMPWKAKITNA